MTLPVVWLTDAAHKFRDAVQWYAKVSPQLGARFGQAVDEIADAPLSFALTYKRQRRAGVRRFPYGLYFLIEDTQVVVVACFHGSRNPLSLQQRSEHG